MKKQPRCGLKVIHKQVRMKLERALGICTWGEGGQCAGLAKKSPALERLAVVEGRS